jgi:hypothetical protein
MNTVNGEKEDRAHYYNNVPDGAEGKGITGAGLYLPYKINLPKFYMRVFLFYVHHGQAYSHHSVAQRIYKKTYPLPGGRYYHTGYCGSDKARAVEHG